MTRYLVTHYCGRRWIARHVIDEYTVALGCQRAEAKRDSCCRSDCEGKHYATIKPRTVKRNAHKEGSK